MRSRAAGHESEGMNRFFQSMTIAAGLAVLPAAAFAADELTKQDLRSDANTAQQLNVPATNPRLTRRIRRPISRTNHAANSRARLSQKDPCPTSKRVRKVRG